MARPPVTDSTASQHDAIDRASLRLALAEQQLADARRQLAEMEALLQELPEIFERKYQQRLQPLLEQHERVLADNRQLRQERRQIGPGRVEPLQLPPAIAAAPAPGRVTPGASRWAFLGQWRQRAA